MEIKLKITNLANKLEQFNENVELIAQENFSVKNGLIFEIMTN